jgi:hypothetical protein
MNRKNITPVTAVFMLAALSSCSPVLYAPVGQNVPFFKEKGEYTVTAGMGGVDNTSVEGNGNTASGFTASAAGAVGKNVAIIAGFNSMTDSEEEGAEITGHGQYFEFGIGKFKYWPKVKMYGDIFLGTGFGHIQNSVNGEPVEANFFKPFIQPSIGYGSSIIDFAFTPKVALVQYTSTKNGLTDPDQYATVETYFTKKKSNVIVEPGFTIRLGYQNIRLQYQGCYTGLSYSETEDFAPINNFYSSLTIYLKFRMPKASKPKA